jgi:alpha-L-fucosidase 2
MVFGGIEKERFQLNHNTLWSGYPDPRNNPDGPQILQCGLWRASLRKKP